MIACDGVLFVYYDRLRIFVETFYLSIKFNWLNGWGKIMCKNNIYGVRAYKNEAKTEICRTFASFCITSLVLCVLGFGLISLNGCILRPYRMDVQQGNILQAATVQQVRIGMTKDEVVDLLGTPMLDNAFARDYWTYVFTSQVNGGKIDRQEVVIHFTSGKVSKINKQNV